MLMSFLIIAALVFLGYALVTQYSKTPADRSVAGRVWASVVAGAAALGAAVASFFQSAPVP
jgi:asparagine N-glycosylation enzyme membrane subunit Stt3